MKKLVTTPLSGTIWWATVDDGKGLITGDKKDVTDNAISAVLDHFIMSDGFRENGFAGYEYDKKDGGMVTICGFDNNKHVAVSKALYDELVEIKQKYDNLCK
ncbi:hypothetical protein DS742_23715 [Lacrimispora amygdalina]|uniref:Uncharacterized protein n=1 Tax=Lacrimispora amygdalina TaxID=253257 RepID=A0A3E2N627_9FIRM|nr:hypothetical protein [Clostridium indicum]RFZ76404.1 hypothetical protein DS742_23715 [Clostridium indicum]